MGKWFTWIYRELRYKQEKTKHKTCAYFGGYATYCVMNNIWLGLYYFKIEVIWTQIGGILDASSAFPGSHEVSNIYSMSQERHDDVMTWKRFLHLWPFVRGIRRWLMGSTHEGLVMRSFYIFLVNIIMLLNSSCRWFETPCNVILRTMGTP